MKPALSEKDSNSPSQWLQLGQGDALSQRISELLSPWWQKIFGYYFLKVGDLSCQINTDDCKVQQQIHLGQFADNIAVRAAADALPVRENSVDAILLAHCLEFVSDPHHVVREAHRVLMPDGYLILTAVNPFSLVGVFSLAPWLKQQYPWRGRFFSASRVKDWLHLVGFEVVSERRFFCSTMLGKEHSQGAWQQWAERYLSFFGASYMLVARKRQWPLTPIRPKWQLSPGYNADVKGVSARQGAR